MSKLVVDLDGTITMGDTSDYANVLPNLEVIQKLREYHRDGFLIAIYTARNMRTYQGDMSKIRENTLPIILAWLKKYNVPYDDIIIGKPWCEEDGFYIDDRAIRPSEFLSMDRSEILDLIAKEAKCFL